MRQTAYFICPGDHDDLLVGTKIEVRQPIIDGLPCPPCPMKSCGQVMRPVTAGEYEEFLADEDHTSTTHEEELTRNTHKA